MAAKILPPPQLSPPLVNAVKSLPAQTLLVVHPSPASWIEPLKSSAKLLPWTVLCESTEPDWGTWKGPRGGLVWQPANTAAATAPPATWKLLPQPWTRLARWYLERLPLQHRHVALLAPPSAQLEGLCSWLLRQGASLSWVRDRSRQVWSQLRLCDVLVVFPDSDTEVEARHLCGGSVMLDFRPTSQIRGTALELTLSAFADAATHSLDALGVALALGLPGMAPQQETLVGLA